MRLDHQDTQMIDAPMPAEFILIFCSTCFKKENAGYAFSQS